MDYTYRLLNVFADGSDPFSGNCVAVFEDASDLTTDQMQSLARQVNTETVFLLPHVDGPRTGVRFFSPEKRTGFAGSASLATAAVIRDLHGIMDDITLTEDSKGEYKVFRRDEWWILQAHETQATALKASPQILASLVGLNTDAIHGDVMTINNGRSGLVLPVRSVEDVRDTRLDARLLHSYAMLLNTEPQVYVWANSDEDDSTIVSRMFYGPRGGVLEVAATGTGGVNLGAWHRAMGVTGIRRRVIQGRVTGHLSELDLRVDEDGSVYVGGRVRQVAQGTFSI